MVRNIVTNREQNFVTREEDLSATDRSRVIFGNEIAPDDYKAACRNKAGFVRKYGDDTALPYPLAAKPAPVIGEALGTWQLIAQGNGEGEEGEGAAGEGATGEGEKGTPSSPSAKIQLAQKSVVVGTIRMGFGHYRIAMAMASAAHALGYTPYWFDLMSFPDTTCTKIISSQNDLYSLGSRVSQKSKLFNAAVWEPMNYEGFRRLSYNASDQKAAELMVRPFASLPEDVPFIGCHAWPSQAAVHAGLTHVVNAIPDNWPMALHLAEGSIHTVQTPNAYVGYKMLRGMQKGKVLRPMPKGSLYETGHYVDHELVCGIEEDCRLRLERAAAGQPVRFLLTVGGAGAQQNLFRSIIRHAVNLVDAGKASLWVNVGDHKNVWENLVADIPALSRATLHFDDFADVNTFATAARTQHIEGVHVFASDDIFEAVYSTNVLMRACDVLMTKPSELAYYPVPKLMLQRVGGHEQWGAVRAAEVGDGTYELRSVGEITATMDLMCESDELLSSMCEHIVAAKALGTYNGAYNVVKLATEGKF